MDLSQLYTWNLGVCRSLDPSETTAEADFCCCCWGDTAKRRKDLLKRLENVTRDVAVLGRKTSQETDLKFWSKKIILFVNQESSQT